MVKKLPKGLRNYHNVLKIIRMIYELPEGSVNYQNDLEITRWF